MSITFSLISVLNYCVPIVSDAESLINFIKNNDVVLNSVVDGIGMVEWVKDTKRVSIKYHVIKISNGSMRVLFSFLNLLPK